MQSCAFFGTLGASIYPCQILHYLMVERPDGDKQTYENWWTTGRDAHYLEFVSSERYRCYQHLSQNYSSFLQLTKGPKKQNTVRRSYLQFRADFLPLLNRIRNMQWAKVEVSCSLFWLAIHFRTRQQLVAAKAQV